jgi:hypothetical protein
MTKKQNKKLKSKVKNKKSGVLSCKDVVARTNIKKPHGNVKKGTPGTIDYQRKTPQGYGRATVTFKGSSAPIEVETSKIRCV